MTALTECKLVLIGRLDLFRDKFYDFIHHVDTFSFVSRADVRIESGNKDLGLPYQRTPFRTINTLFRQLTWHDSTAFIDFGCGKGLVLLAAARYRFTSIVGVEYSSDLVAIARNNARRYRGALPSKQNLSIVHGDATQFEFPNTPLICYFYNPFQPAIMHKVFDNLALSLTQFPRDVQLVFHIRYPRDLVYERFEITDCKRIPYFHIYRLGRVKQKSDKSSTANTPWKLIDTED